MARDFAKKFYSSKQWQDCRNEYMKCAGYLCEDCLKRGVYRPGIEVTLITLSACAENAIRQDTNIMSTGGMSSVLTGKLS